MRDWLFRATLVRLISGSIEPTHIVELSWRSINVPFVQLPLLRSGRKAERQVFSSAYLAKATAFWKELVQTRIQFLLIDKASVENLGHRSNQ
jgi:hypothetical protein